MTYVKYFLSITNISISKQNPQNYYHIIFLYNLSDILKLLALKISKCLDKSSINFSLLAILNIPNVPICFKDNKLARFLADKSSKTTKSELISCPVTITSISP